MKVAFENEARDQAWAANFEQMIKQAMMKFQSSKLVSAGCKTTICKIEVDHDGPIDAQK